VLFLTMCLLGLRAWRHQISSEAKGLAAASLAAAA
jgi:hypothetical protein